MRLVRTAAVGALLLCGGVLSFAAAAPSAGADLAPGPAAETDSDYRAFALMHQRKQVEERLQRVVADERRLETSTLDRGRAYVRMMRLGLLPMSDGFDGMVSHANRAERLRRSLARDMVEATRLRREEKGLRAGLERAKRQNANAPAPVLDYQRTREAIEAAREREIAYRRAFQGEYSDQPQHTAVYGATPAQPTAAGSFAEARGRLLFPIKGRSEMQAGTVPGASGPGLVVKAAGGAQVHNVFRGKVILAGDYGDLGLGLVVDHGGGYTTLLTGLASFVAEVGDEVAAGAVVAELPDDGASVLYFEIRQQGIPLEPADWFGI